LILKILNQILIMLSFFLLKKYCIFVVKVRTMDAGVRIKFV